MHNRHTHHLLLEPVMAAQLLRHKHPTREPGTLQRNYLTLLALQASLDYRHNKAGDQLPTNLCEVTDVIPRAAVPLYAGALQACRVFRLPSLVVRAAGQAAAPSTMRCWLPAQSP
jgi:hypothetical protein